jgi:hypothetical protein
MVCRSRCVTQLRKGPHDVVRDPLITLLARAVEPLLVRIDLSDAQLDLPNSKRHSSPAAPGASSASLGSVTLST